MDWYYADGEGNELGPVAEEQIKALVSEGKINGTTMVWKDGMAEWAAAATTSLGSLLSVAPPTRPIHAPMPTGKHAVASVDGFDRDDSVIYPQNPPRSPHLAWLNLLGPGLAQIVHGKVAMGVTCVAIYSVTNMFIYFLPGVGIIILALIAATVVDAYMTANVLQKGHTVGKWRMFPTNRR